MPFKYYFTCVTWGFEKILFIYLERGERKNKERERNINVWFPLTCPPTADQACNAGMCPDWEWNRQPFGLLARAQSTESTSQGSMSFNTLFSLLFCSKYFLIYFVISPLTHEFFRPRGLQLGLDLGIDTDSGLDFTYLVVDTNAPSTIKIEQEMLY